MKRLTTIFLISLLTLPLVACQKGKNKGTSVQRIARGSPGAVGTVNNPQPGQQASTQTVAGRNNGRVGVIWRGQSFTNQDFDFFVHEFVTSFMNKEDLGTVSGEYNANTGIRWWGYVETTQGRINPYSTTTLQIVPQNSQLRIWIWDSYAASGQATEVPVEIHGSASGWIQGGQAQVTFQDQYGSITFGGTVDANNFRGYVIFDNAKSVYGGTPAANYLGEFEIETCSFFRCN